jgi:hypothetical protein
MLSSTPPLLRHSEYRSANLLVYDWPPDHIVRSYQECASHPQAIGVAVRDGDGFASVDAVNHGSCIEIRPIYEDRHNDFVNSVVREAVMAWPPRPTTPHQRCEKCWDVSPAIGIRFQEKDQRTRTVVLYKARGCGDLLPVLDSIEEKIAFLRQRRLGVFLVWVANFEPVFGKECDLN